MKTIHFICCLLLFVSCKQSEQQLTKITAKNIAIDSTLQSSATIDSLVAPYKRKLIAEMETVLCFAPVNFTKQTFGLQTNLGNLMADLCMDIANPMFIEKTGKKIDFTMFNNGGLRAPISKGNVTLENAFQLMPFDNEFVVVELSGDKIIELVQYISKNKKAHPVSKDFALTLSKDDFQLVIKGEKFDKNKTYFVLTSDYLQGGGDKMYFFKDPIQLIKLDYKVRDGIIDYFKKTDTLKATIDKRVILN